MSNMRIRLWWHGIRGFRAVATLAMLTATVLGAGPAWTATTANANSPLGINLLQVNYFTAEQPFLDIFKTNGGFTTQNSSGANTSEEKYLNLDANGWPISLKAVNNPSPQQFTKVSTLVLRDLPDTPNGRYPAGQYVVRYQGKGTLTYNYDAKKVDGQSAPGRDVINVAAKPPGGGILITIASTDPDHNGNYIRNIQLVKAEQESLLLAGKVFSPTFLNLMQNFRTLRFMDWFNTNGSTLASWSNRPSISNATWASTAGVPYEVALQLVNTLSADPWINIPVMADDNFVTQFATLVHTKLGSTQKVYVEFSNEVWNSGFPQYAYSNSQGRAMWPNAGSGADYGNNWYGMKTAQICDTWKSVWGSDASRVVCVMAAQAANPWVATERLECKLWSGAPCSGHGIGAVAIAPYFGGKVPSGWTSQSDGGLSLLFASLTSKNDPSIPTGGWLGQALGWIAAYPAAIAKYNLPLIAYEGGQTFVSFPNGVENGKATPMTSLFVTANRDPRMKTAYEALLQGWKASGGQMFTYFNDIFPASQYGLWGGLESFMQTTSPLSSAPPKWQALQNFISTNPCWWAGCAGTLAAIPNAPNNLQVH
jgi:hypothetical protein